MAATAVDVVGTVLAARRPEDIFGSAEVEDARIIYRRLARNVHPDRQPEDDKQRASDAFANLERLWQLLQNNGAPKIDPTITTKKHSYTLGERIGRGDFANVYSATYDAGHETCAIKIARKPSDADLISAEVRALKKLRDVPDEYRIYHPELVDSFRHRDAARNVDRSAVVINRLDGFYTLQEIVQAYPGGVDPRDMAWMFRRLLVAAGTAHDAGLVHGAVTPNNVMIHPEQHGLVLVGWTCSVEVEQSLRAISPGYRDYYSAAALEKKPVTGSLDISMAASSMQHILPVNTPRQFHGFFRGCKISSTPPARELLVEFDELLERMYGRRTFRPFSMPDRKRK